VNLEDRTRATNAFVRHARSYAEQAAFIEDAKQETEDKLKDLLEPYATEVIVQYSSPSIELP
jgi:NADPH-dependent 7-cyano-7-deazaguanine reductase QueF